MDKIKLKKWVPIFENKDSIILGIPGSSKSIEISKNLSNYNFIKDIISDQNSSTYNFEINRIIEKLYKLNFLTKRDKWKISRKELFFDYLDDSINISEILGTRILIFGAGAGGATLTYLLAQTGFTKIKVIDDDVVETSDIQKTLIFNNLHLGEKKVHVLKNIIKKNFEIDIEVIDQIVTSHDEIKHSVSSWKPNFVVKACDPDLTFRLSLNMICVEEKIPHIHMSYSFDTLIIGPLYNPGKTCCDNAYNNHLKRSLDEKYDLKNIKKIFNQHHIHPSINFNINILASFILKEIIFFQLNKFDFVKSLGKIVYFSPINFNGTSIKFECDESCTCKI